MIQKTHVKFKKELKKGVVKHKGKQFEAAVKMHKKSDLLQYLDSLLMSFKSREPEDKELEFLLKALGKRLKVDKESGTYTIESIVPFDQCPKCGDATRPSIHPAARGVSCRALVRGVLQRWAVAEVPRPVEAPLFPHRLRARLGPHHPFVVFCNVRTESFLFF